MKKIHCHCINLRRAANFVTKLYDEVLCPIGLTVNQYYLILNIELLGKCSVQELANEVGLERTSVVRNLKPLFKSGLISDNAEKKERSCSISLTAKGREVFKQGQNFRVIAQEKIENLIGVENIETLEKILAILV